MAMSHSQAARLERRLRLGIRLVFYPLCLGLIALAWSRYHRSSPTMRILPALVWTGATKQGLPVRAVTVGGVLTSLHANVVTHCLNGSTFTLRPLHMTSAQFKQTGDIINGRQGPALTTSDEGEPVLIATRMRARMDDQPHGTILAEVTLSPGPRSVQCSSDELDYTLRRETHRLQ
jgi:hypothetical protein